MSAQRILPRHSGQALQSPVAHPHFCSQDFECLLHQGKHRLAGFVVVVIASSVIDGDGLDAAVGDFALVRVGIDNPVGQDAVLVISTMPVPHKAAQS